MTLIRGRANGLWPFLEVLEAGRPMSEVGGAMPSNGQIDDILDRIADGFSRQQRSPVLHSPSDQGLDYENVTFPARDGVPLEG